MGRTAPWLWAALVASLLASATALARVESESPYTKRQTYNTALRYLRVDLGYRVTEKDPDAAYLLFEYVPTGQRAPHNGSIEIIRARETVKLFVQLPQMPQYHEEVLKDGLMKKLREEYGEPPKRKPPPDEPGDGPDAGAH